MELRVIAASRPKSSTQHRAHSVHVPIRGYGSAALTAKPAIPRHWIRRVPRGAGCQHPSHTLRAPISSLVAILSTPVPDPSGSVTPDYTSVPYRVKGMTCEPVHQLTGSGEVETHSVGVSPHLRHNTLATLCARTHRRHRHTLTDSRSLTAALDRPHSRLTPGGGCSACASRAGGVRESRKPRS